MPYFTRAKTLKLAEKTSRTAPPRGFLGQTLDSTPTIPNTLAYIAGGNAWIIEDSPYNRRPVVNTGDLDGRVFFLSSDHKWLLFTRKSAKPPDKEINTLWVINIDDARLKMINLGVSNVVHFADFSPDDDQVIYYSTVEPRSTAPGWQANNDLKTRRFDNFGVLSEPTEIISPSSGGVYGWWGMDYAWSPDGELLIYSRPDGIGLVDLKTKTLQPLMDITPLNTRSDWALIPEITWAADGKSILVVTHAPSPSLISPEESPFYDLTEVFLDGSNSIVEQSGMFAFPNTSPLYDKVFYVAYLQAIFPEQSSTSRYRLVVMNFDGSNQRVLFPQGDLPGLEPGKPVWQPVASEKSTKFIAVVYMGNIWLININTSESYQLTSDGLITKIDWK